jgi:hypothetical protein
MEDVYARKDHGLLGGWAGERASEEEHVPLSASFVQTSHTGAKSSWSHIFGLAAGQTEQTACKMR